MENIFINPERLSDKLVQLSSIGRLEPKGVCRLALSPEDKAARDLLASWMNDLGLDVRVDKLGNMFGIYNASKGDKYVALGSHLDTVPTGGYYDGSLGVLAALEVIQTIKENNITLPFNLVLTNFTNEEGVRFTPDMMGSFGYANPEHVEEIWQAKDESGISVKESLVDIGYLGDMKPGKIQFDYFVELHIEQGPVLESAKLDIGIVEKIQALRWYKIIIKGEGNHAGTTPINLRKDAFYALNKLALFGRELCTKYDNQLFTIGSIIIKPNAINIIPELAGATLDMRNPSDDILENAVTELNKFINDDEAFDKLEVEVSKLSDVPSTECNAKLTGIIEQSCKELNYSYKRMYSGASHDTQLLAPKYPSAMIFIPSKNGISHSPEEYSSREQIEKGANVLLHSILNLGL